MLHYYLENAVSDLTVIIAMTQDDIADIKQAHHDAQFERMALKQDRITSFEAKKALIDNEVLKRQAQSPEQPLQELLDTKEHALLGDLKARLQELKEVNQHYAKMVASVGSFYNSLLEKVMPTERDGYQVRASSNGSLLKVSV